MKPAGANPLLAPVLQPHLAPAPATRNTQTTVGEAMMFGRIDNFEADKNVFTNNVGSQTNQRLTQDLAASASRPHLPPQPNSDKSRKNVVFYDGAGQGPPAAYNSLEVTSSVVTALYSASKLCPVPFLAQAASIVLAILQGVQVRSQKVLHLLRQ